ncbi:putative toxin-antitoxin system antitoxin component (TIGR02293 family) [Duganella sp. SG902]|uniref:antitoxin Xre/MbcA/ParS toxin-binding domain-containing protein n=1 Tax=Duganella sp. SG902 TaxID=2587016 RepID=UPI00159E4460|nr:antitoxin Xre/MbcA/ParS toxin-binding domain-containing protein [Duganella sp. SG902]NVM77454.1 putative toxin-antitoxin system antitoxin component (TIGR02293 family) [Duganella sp. SG902]
MIIGSGDTTFPAYVPPDANEQPFVGADIGDPPGPASFDDLMRQFGANRSAAVAAIRIGFPATLLDDASRYFEISNQRICAVARLPEATVQALKHGALLDAAASERLWRLADLMRMARAVFENDEAAKSWLRTPSAGFNNAAPMDYLDTEPGAIVVRHALAAVVIGGS